MSNTSQENKKGRKKYLIRGIRFVYDTAACYGREKNKWQECVEVLKFLLC